MDVLIVAGYNDIIEVYSREYIMYEFSELTKMIINLNKEPNEVPNTVAIAGLYYPPQLAWYLDNPVPAPNYVNQTEKLVC